MVDLREHSEKGKVCTKCRVFKLVDEFYVQYRRVNQEPVLYSECKECSKNRVREYRKKNLEFYHEMGRRYYRLNKEQHKIVARKYQKRHKKRISVCVMIRYYQKKLGELGMRVEKFNSRGKTDEQVKEHHLFLKRLYKEVKG